MLFKVFILFTALVSFDTTMQLGWRPVSGYSILVRFFFLGLVSTESFNYDFSLIKWNFLKAHKYKYKETVYFRDKI